METPSHTLTGHPIGVAARRARLSPDSIRAWERRYGAVRPRRSATGRRLYSERDITRLALLRRLVEQGWTIGSIATLPDTRLRAELAGDSAPAGSPTEPLGPSTLQECLRAIGNLDGEALRDCLEGAAVRTSRIALLERVLAPLLQEVGDRCARGDLRAAHEHLASATLRSFIGSMRGATQDRDVVPAIVVTTPARQVHEFGALMVAAAARAEGWDTVFLGVDLPAEEIAAAARMRRARAVALSITYPADDPALDRELRRLGRMLGDASAILVGGGCASAYRSALETIGARQVKDLQQLRDELSRLRATPTFPPDPKQGEIPS